MPTQKQYQLSPLARVLKEYRAKYDITQEQLANELSIDVRTVRRYENNETILTDVFELRRIADVLGLDTERLGVIPELNTLEQIDAALERVWALERLARITEAQVLAERLVQAVSNLIRTEDEALLRRLAFAHHVTGFIKSQTTRATETAIPFFHYQEMERIARILNDQTLLNIALTYEGDMRTRGGNVLKGIEYLEAARNITQADASARGNGIQLLGRAYFKAGRFGDFERVMGETEEIAASLHQSDPVRGQYELGTVYEEYGRSYGQLGQLQKGMDYLGKADAEFSKVSGKNRDVLMKTAEAMVLVRGGELREGIQVAIESVHLCKLYGNARLLERIYGVQQYIDKLTREIGQSGGELREALYGPVEY